MLSGSFVFFDLERPARKRCRAAAAIAADDPDKAESLVLIVSIRFLAGVFGKDVVQLAGKKFIEQATAAGRSAVKEGLRASSIHFSLLRMFMPRKIARGLGSMKGS